MINKDDNVRVVEMTVERLVSVLKRVINSGEKVTCGLGRLNNDPIALPVNPLPPQREHLTGTAEATIPTKGDNDLLTTLA